MTAVHRASMSIVSRIAAVAVPVVMLAAAIILLSGESLTWIELMIPALGFTTVMFYCRNPRQALLYTFLLTVPIDISKALIVPVGEIYTPGLYINVSDIFFVGYALLWLFDKALVSRSRIEFDKLTQLVFVFTVYMWLSALLAEDKFGGLLVAVTHTKFFLVFLVLSDSITHPRQLRGIVLVLACGLVLQLGMTGAQQLTGSYLALAGSKMAETGNLVFSGAGGLHAFRPTGFLNHPILLADYLVFLLLPLFGLVLLGSTRLRHIWIVSLLLFAGALGGLILTLARSGWIAFALSAVLFLFLGFRQGIVSRQQIAALTLLAVLGAATTAIVYPAAYLRLTEGDQRSSEGRLLMMDQARLIIQRHPITGVGLGGYNRAAHSDIPESFSYVGKDFQDGLIKLGIVHNKYLLVAAEHGIVGLLLFVAILWKMGRLFFSVPRWSDSVYLTLGLGLTCGIFAQAVLYLFEHFYVDIGLEFLWVFGGILLALTRMQQQHAGSGQVRAAA